MAEAEASSDAAEEDVEPSEEPSDAAEEEVASAEEPAPEPAEAPAAETSDDVADALAAALASGEGQPAAAQEGPPMTEGELGDLRRAISGCWNVDVGSAAAGVTVTIAFQMSQDRKVAGDVRLVSSSGGDASAAEVAFQAARRAVLRCQNQGSGFPLPPEKFATWQSMELTFDPSQMALR